MKPKHLFAWLFVFTFALSTLVPTLRALAAPPAQEPTPVPEASGGPEDPLPPELAALPQAALARIEPLVIDELAAASETDYFIWLDEKADLRPAARFETKEEKGRFVFEALRQTAERSQAALREALDQQGVEYQPFFIANKILVRGGNAAVLASLAARPDVARITANHGFQLEEPFVDPAAPAQILAIEPNLSFINADDVWALGVDGFDTVLAGNDTGLDWDHPALIDQYRGWDGVAADHNYNWWDATSSYPDAPGDGYGHGTHTTGTMVGDDGGNNRIGVAPGARTIHCKNMTDDGWGFDATFIECFQWDLAPWDLNGVNPRPDLAPDAINNSWGYWGGDQPMFEDEIAALQAAGILVEVSAGNEGSGCASLGSPGDYRQVLTTGSVDHAGGVLPGDLTWFSSRGPSDLYPNPPDYFPDVMAPGENIRSSVPGGGYQGGWSGTSMSGPHVTGLVGLIWSANPGLRGQVEMTMELIRSTAVPLTGQSGSNCGGDYTNGPNNDWGHGTIDALAAVEQALQFGGAGTLAGTVTAAGSGTPIAGATITATAGPNLNRRTSTDAQGHYLMQVISGTYTVDATRYGYLPAQVSQVAVVSGTTTTLDLALDPAASHVVSGFVTDGIAGWPLHASLIIDGYPGDPIWTDPLTGFYSVSLAEGVAYTFHVAASGYAAQSRAVGPLTGDQTEDFALQPDYSQGCPASYEEATIFYDGFEAVSLASSWSITTTNNGRVGVSTAYPYAGRYSVLLDNALEYYPYSLAAIILAHDLSGEDQVNLDFWWREFYDENDPEDGVFISDDDGATWHQARSFNNGPQEFRHDIVDLTAAAATHGLALNDRFRIKFQFYDNYPIPTDGYALDEIRLFTCLPPARTTGRLAGYVYDANTGLPLPGATVASDDGQSTAVDAIGLYQLFQTSGTHTLTATLSGGYEPVVQTVTVMPGATVQQDFNLPAGRLAYSSPPLEVTLDPGASTTMVLTLSNTGALAASFEVQEWIAGYPPVAAVQGRGEWLYRAETGVELPANTGPDGSALAYPSAYRWQPTSPSSSPSVLIYADDAYHRAPNTYLDQALRSLGWSYTAHYFGDWAGFEADLAAGAWDLVLVANDAWSPPVSTLTALDDYVRGGGKLALHSWDVGSYYDHPLWTTLGLNWVSDDYSPPDPVYWWASKHPAFTSPHSVPEFTALTDSRYYIYGERVEPLSGFIALAGYTSPGPDPNEAALILGQDGRTIFKGFLDGQNDADLDADSWPDGVELWINLISNLANGFKVDISWLSETPISGTLASLADESITITFDAGVPEITRPGLYVAQLRIANDTPYGTATIPVTMTVTGSLQPYLQFLPLVVK